MKLISWNVNGLTERLKQGFEQVLADFDADIVCLQEIKLQKDAFKQDFQGYEAYWNCAVEKGKHGTAILTKFHPISVRFDIGVDKLDKEGRLTVAEFASFYLVCYYSPIGYREDMDDWLVWQSRVRGFVCKLKKEKPVIFCGDFNVAHEELDLFNPDSAKYGEGFKVEERNHITKLIEAGFLDSLRYVYPSEAGKYTWWFNDELFRNNKGRRLDYFFVSKELKNRIKDAEIYPGKVKGDHCPISLTIDLEMKIVRNFMKIDDAIMVATMAHWGQKRKGTDIPYITHPLKVMTYLLKMRVSEDVIYAGILHDTVEDGGLTKEGIAEKFWPEVANLVSKHSENKSLPWRERKENELKELENGPRELQIMVLADKLANSGDMLEDYRKVGDQLWQRFNKGKADQKWYYQEGVKALAKLTTDDVAEVRDHYAQFKAIVVELFGEKI